MSKAVTNEEVEDVLSSIRRLVSEDKRPLAGLRATPSEPATPEPDVGEPASAPDAQGAEAPSGDAADVGGTAAPSDHFVLTPALRIAEPPEQITEDAPLDLGLVARETWSDEGEDSEDQDGVEEASEDDTNAPLVLFPKEDETDQEKDSTDGHDPAMDAVDALIHDALEADAQGEAGEDDDTGGDYADESYWDEEDTPEQAAEQSEPEVAQEDSSETADEADAQDAPDAEAISILPLTAKIAALEAAVGGIKQEWEPDGSEEADMAPADAPAMAWEDDVDLDANGAPIPDAPVQVDEAPAVEELDQTPEADHADEAKPAMAGLSADDQLLDEEALHALVSEIVRAELQGALGERITRNVRKLVRREIHRAMTAQDLE